MTMTKHEELEVTKAVFRAIADHIEGGGSFRYLIYDRLGFGPEAYAPLYDAGGMVITNFIHDAKEQTE